MNIQESNSRGNSGDPVPNICNGTKSTAHIKVTMATGNGKGGWDESHCWGDCTKLYACQARLISCLNNLDEEFVHEYIKRISEQVFVINV